MNGAKDGKEGDYTKSGRYVVSLEVCGDKNWAGCVDVIILGCPPAADAAEGAVHIVLERNDLEGLDEGELFGEGVRGDAGVLCEAKEGDEPEDSNDGV